MRVRVTAILIICAMSLPAQALSLCAGGQLFHNHGAVLDAEVYPFGFGGFDEGAALFHGPALSLNFDPNQAYASVFYGIIFLRNTLGLSAFAGPTINILNRYEVGGSATVSLCPLATGRVSFSVVHDLRLREQRIMLRILGGLSLPVPIITKEKGEHVQFMAFFPREED